MENLKSGHLGCRKTRLRVEEACYFPKLREFYKHYVESCFVYQRHNYRNLLGDFLNSIWLKCHSDSGVGFNRGPILVPLSRFANTI